MSPTPPLPHTTGRAAVDDGTVRLPAAFKLIWVPAVTALVAIEVLFSPLVERPVLLALVALTLVAGGAVVVVLGSGARRALAPSAIAIAVLANACAIATALISSAGNDIAIMAPLLGALLLASVFEGRRLLALFGVQWVVGVVASWIAYSFSDLRHVPNADLPAVSVASAAVVSLIAYSLLWWVRFRLTEAVRAARAAAGEARAAEIAAQTAAGALRSFLTASPLPALEVAPDGKVRFANPAAEALLDAIAAPGVTGAIGPDGVTGPTEPRRIPDEWLEHGLRGDTASAEPAPLLLADGRTLRVEMHTAVERSGSSVTGLILQVVDVTDREAMAAQRATADRLEAVGRMAGGIAHDFNNLLTAVSGHAELLEEDMDPDDERLRDVEGIRQAASRGADLVGRLLMFSRRERLAPIRFDTSALVASIEPMLSRVIGGQVQLAFDLERRPLPVIADPVQLEQVLLNLVINARDAMPAGGMLTVRTSIGTAILPGDEGPVPAAMLEVSDTGDGMDEATLRRIFEPFFTTKAGRGTGLGLTTALSIVRGSGGTLTADSHVGHGSVIRVSLPIAGDASEPAVTEREAPSAPGEPTPGGSERLLVIDDEPAVREIARRHLVSLGYEVVVADGAASALSAAAAAAFDMVLTDVVMPEVRGPELVSRLRARDPGLRAVFMTGFAEVDPFAADPGGIDGRVLGKPFDRAQIGGFVRSALDEVDETAGAAT